MRRAYDEIKQETVFSELHRILKSDSFDASERNCKFFEYVVKESLAGRAGLLKAYNIATTVFGRDSDFDPQNDPIVRIEARRLRRSLEFYYLTAGKNDELIISIPKGGYAPQFGINKAIQSVPPCEAECVLLENKPETSNLSLSKPAIFVMAFAEEGVQTTLPNFTLNFSRALIVALTRFKDLAIFGNETNHNYGQNVNLDRRLADLGIDFVIKGGAMISQDRLNVEVMLIDARGAGQILWAENIGAEWDPESILRDRDQLANKIARILAQPFGVIFSHKARKTEDIPPEDLNSYDNTIQYYNYWKSIDPDLYFKARVQLEQAISQNPADAEAFAYLSLIYTDSYRFGFDSGLEEEDSRDRALSLANRAIALSPSSSRGYQARALAYWFMGDKKASLDSLEIALSFNPNDTELMADLGLHYAMVTEWNRAVPILEKAYRQNPALPDTFRVGLSLFHLAHGRYREALNEARKFNARRVVYGYVLVAAAAAGLGLQEEAASAVNAITSIDSDYGQHIVMDLQKRKLHPDLIELIVDLLEQAGLPQKQNNAQIINLEKSAPTRSP